MSTRSHKGVSSRQRGWRLGVKQLFDRTIGAGGLVLTSPILLATAIVVRASMGSPVVFRQVRPGLGGRPFEVLKFRTMRDAMNTKGEPLPDEERLTRIGRFLRSTSLDELPQLFNLVKGEVSLVGPRPLLTRYLPRYTERQARRHDVLPGITGWAQVNGRNAISWEEKFELDVWYVDHWSLWLDAKILAKTAVQVIVASGVSNPGHVTMPEFMGTAEARGRELDWRLTSRSGSSAPADMGA